MIRFLFFMLTFTAASLAYANITVHFQPDNITAGQSTQLIFTSTEPFKEHPNLSVLQNDFEIAGAQTRFSSNIINGQKSTKHELVFNVLPLKTGTLTVPGFKIGNQTTSPAHLSVSESTTPTQQIPDITLTASVSQESIYEGESLLYQAVLTENTGVFSAEIKPPFLENATIEQFSDDSVRLIYQNQKPARVLTRTYLITPHATGKHLIQPARFFGQIPRERNTDTFSAFGTQMDILFAGLPSLSQDILLTAKPIELTVHPKPTSYGTDWWLPARELALNLLTPAPESGRDGEPITLVFELIAIGTDANELPEITLPASTAFKVYANPSQRQNFIDSSDRFAGRVAQEFNLIPLQDGTFNLPLPHVVWFNSTTAQKENATLPPIKIDIYPSPLTPAATLNSASPPAPSQPIPLEEKNTAKTPLLPPTFVEQSLKWGSTAVFFLLALTGIGLIIFIVRKKQKNKKSLPDLYPY